MKYQIRTEPTRSEWNSAVMELADKDSYFVKWYDNENKKKNILRILIKDKKGNWALLYKAVVQKKEIALLNLLNVRCGRRETPGLFLAEHNTDKKHLISLLLKEIKKHLRKYGFFKISYISFFAKAPLPVFEKWSWLYKYTQLIDLSKDEDDILKEMKAKTRKQAKDAKLRKVIIKQKNDIEGIRACYNLKERYFERAVIENTPKEKFIKNIKEQINSGRLCIFLAYLDEKPIGFAIIGKGPNKLYYHTGGYDPDYSQNRPINLLFWEIMKWGKKQGMDYFDLCGTGTKYFTIFGPKEKWRDSGRTRFKKGFGGEEKEYLKYHRIFTLGISFNLRCWGLLERLFWGE